MNSKRDLTEVKTSVSAPPQIKIRRSKQFGSNGSLDVVAVPPYATLPRSTSRRQNPASPQPPHSTRSPVCGDTPHSRTLPKQPRKTTPPPGVLTRDEDRPVAVSISTIPCMKINRISKEEQLAKLDEKKRKKAEYFQSTPCDQLKVTQQDLEAYVLFYENKLVGIVADMDSNIAVEKKKKVGLEARLKFLLDDNDSLLVQLAGIRKDLKQCQSMTETPV